MEQVNCNYCGRDEADVVSQGGDLLLDRPGAYRLVQCRHCGLIYQNPRPTLEELAQHYPNDYQPYQRGMVENDSLWRRLDRGHEMSRRCKRLMRYHSEPGHLLEVGCSTGLFLVAMRERGWQVRGVELSPYAAEYARKTFNLDVATGSLEEVKLEDHAFDVVALWDVLEHVIDPKSTLSEISRILKPGGLFVASLPNPASIEARVFGSHWVGWDRPRHLHLFTPAVIEHYLTDAGFEAPTIESFSGRLGVTLMSVEFAAKARGIPEKRWRPLTRIAYGWPFRLATWPLYRLLGALNRSSIMTVFARRL